MPKIKIVTEPARIIEITPVITTEPAKVIEVAVRIEKVERDRP